MSGGPWLSQSHNLSIGELSAGLEDQTYGLGAKTDGTFVIVSLKVHSVKDESATLTDDTIKLETSEGNSYSTDSDGTIAAIGANQQPLWFEDIGPTLRSKVVFDVPPSVIANQRLRVRFNELGFGSTHGYIRLPRAGA
jgi:hypothetical protein